jgi:superfamily II DNA/RNA helicase
VIGDWDGRVQRLGREAFAARTNDRAQLRSATLLRVIRDDDTPMPSFTFDARELAGAAQLARIGELNRSARERRRDPDVLRAIAEVFEDLAAGLEPGSPQRIPWLTTAAATWSLAGYQANSVVLASTLIGELDAVRDLRAAASGSDADSGPRGEAEAAMATVLDGTARIVAAVLVRDVNAVARLASQASAALPGLGAIMIGAGNDYVDAADDGAFGGTDSPASLSSLAVLAAYGLLGRSATALARFWITGDRAAAATALASLDQATMTLLNAGVVDTFNLVDNLAHVVEDIVAVSPWRRLRDTDRWVDRWRYYLSTRALDRYPLLQVWPSQQAAIDSGLLRAPRSNLLITMPTSAGKTNIAEWAILDAVGGTENKCAVYIVPTRSLASEAEATLSRSLSRLGLTVSAMFGGLEHVDHELDLLIDSHVVVATSEKLDLLMRNSPEFAERIALVIVDEGHLIGDRARGLRLELMLTRLRRRAPSARLLLISAVVPNFDGLGGWLLPTDPGRSVSNSSWSPSRLRVGVFGWQGAERHGQTGTVRYRPDDADPNFFVPRVLTQHVPPRGKHPFPSDKKDVAAALVLHYQRLGPVLVGSTTRPNVESVAKALVVAHRRRRGITRLAAFAAAVEGEATEERRKLADVVDEVAGAGHQLRQMVLLGIAYHHAGLPDRLRKAFEQAYRDGDLDVLVATSTLSQGINLPAKTVIVSHTTRGQGEYLSARDFWNLAGRAGRAFGETEGHVVLVASTAAEQTRLENRYRSRDNIEPVNSQLVVLFVALVRARLPAINEFSQIPADLDVTDDDPDTLSELRDVLDDQVLAMLVEEAFDSADEAELDAVLASFAHDTFGARQIGANEIAIPAFTRYIGGRGRRVLSAVPAEARRVFMRTGLGVGDNLAALAAVDEILADVTLRDPANEALLIDRIIHDALQLPTMVRFCERDQVTSTAVENLAKDWIRGYEVDALRQSHPAVAPGDPMRFLTALDSIVCRDLPWAVSSLLIMLDFRDPDFAAGSPMLMTLTSMLKFGVPTPGACFASSMGVTARADAIGVGALFATSGGLTYQVFRTWLDIVSRQELIDASSIPAADRLLARVGRRRSSSGVLDAIGRGDAEKVLRLVVPAADEDAALRAQPGAPIAFRRTPSAENPDRIVVDDAHSRTIGQLAPKDAHTMAPLLDSGVLDGMATVRQRSMLQSGRVLLRISVELTPITASARR